MSLPVKPLATGEVTIDGTTVPLTGLSRADAITAGRLGREDIDESEATIIAAGTGVTLEEARQWRKDVDYATAGVLLDAIAALSALTGSDGKDPKGRTSGR